MVDFRVSGGSRLFAREGANWGRGKPYGEGELDIWFRKDNGDKKPVFEPNEVLT